MSTSSDVATPPALPVVVPPAVVPPPLLPSASGRTRVAIFGTHPKQFNGYSKVVYELVKAMTLAHPRIDLHVFGFQNFHNHPGHRLDVPIEVTLYDAHAEENPKTAGFGVPLVKAFVERVRPDVCVVFNDMMVLNGVLNELKDAPGRAGFKVLAYVDQVYLCQRREYVDMINRLADGAIAFTPEWRDCIQWQGLTVPCHVLPHGFNSETYFPVPRSLVRRFYGVSDDDFLVLNLNRNQPRKRWDTCLQAFAEVVHRRPSAPIKLVIATELKGAWDLVELFQRELRKRGADVANGMSKIVIPGHPQMLTDQETNVLYNLADIGINTCDGEGFGLCNFEQAAIGIPQIVPRLGGFLHFFDDSRVTLVDPVTSIYVDSTRDGVGGEAQLTRSVDYADAILRYYDDAALRGKHGRAAREHIRKEFPWSKIADRFATIIDLTVPPAPAAPPPPPAALASGGADTDADDAVDVSLVLEALGPPDAGAPTEADADPKDAIRNEMAALKRRLEELLVLSA